MKNHIKPANNTFGFIFEKHRSAITAHAGRSTTGALPAVRRYHFVPEEGRTVSAAGYGARGPALVRHVLAGDAGVRRPRGGRLSPAVDRHLQGRGAVPTTPVVAESGRAGA